MARKTRKEMLKGVIKIPRGKFPKSDAKFVMDVREDVLRAVEDGDTVTCPCCQQGAAPWPRTMYVSVVKALIRLYRLSKGRHGTYFHVQKDLQSNAGGDFSKLTLGHGLTRVKNTRTADENALGMYCLTAKGKLFVEKKISLPKYIVFYNGEIVGRPTQPKVNIEDCLGKKFSYQELLHGALK